MLEVLLVRSATVLLQQQLTELLKGVIATWKDTPDYWHHHTKELKLFNLQIIQSTVVH